MKFFFGTTNQYKIRELAAILRPLGIELAVTDPLDPEETGSTLEENALIKAVAYGRYMGDKLAHELVSERGCSLEQARIFLWLAQNWVISEDSGITIPALGGLPGPWSARFDDCELDGHRIIGHRSSGRTRDEIDAANNLRLLNLMQGISQPHRAASFGISLMVADLDGNILFRTQSEVAGWIVEEPRGNQGFGYDPIFASGSSFGKTWAEIDPMRKNLISHRRRALQEFTAWLGRQLKSLKKPEIVIEGNDGVGKSTLVQQLRAAGLNVADRGIVTKMTNDPTLRPPSNQFFIILDAPVEVSRARLAQAGKDLNEQYHTVEDLTLYRQRFLDVANVLGSSRCCVIDATGSPGQVFDAVMRVIRSLS